MSFFPNYPQQQFYPQQMDPMAQMRQLLMMQQMRQPGISGQPVETAQQRPPAMIWVSNFQEADTWPVAANEVIPLWDRNGKYCYWRSADAAGRPSTQIIQLAKLSEMPKEEDDAVKRSEFNQLVNIVHGMAEVIKGYQTAAEAKEGIVNA